MSLHQCMADCATSNLGSTGLAILVALGALGVLGFILRVIFQEEIKKAWNRFLERNRAQTEFEKLQSKFQDAELRANEAAGLIRRLHDRNEELIRERAELNAKLNECLNRLPAC